MEIDLADIDTAAIRRYINGGGILSPGECLALLSEIDELRAELFGREPPSEDSRILHVAVDRAGRTWRVLEREDESFSLYYTVEGSPTHHVIYDSLDVWTDPPRVLLGRAQEAERKALQHEHKAKQYDDVVATLEVADGGRYRNDTIEALVTGLAERERLQYRIADLIAALNDYGRHAENCTGRPCICGLTLAIKR